MTMDNQQQLFTKQEILTLAELVRDRLTDRGARIEDSSIEEREALYDILDKLEQIG